MPFHFPTLRGIGCPVHGLSNSCQPPRGPIRASSGEFKCSRPTATTAPQGSRSIRPEAFLHRGRRARCRWPIFTARAVNTADRSKRSQSVFVSGSTVPTDQEEHHPVSETFIKISGPDSKGVSACIKQPTTCKCPHYIRQYMSYEIWRCW
jgi:hypothetical protein